MTGVLIRRENGDTHRGKTATSRQRQKLEGCSHKPENAKDFWLPPEGGRSKEEFFPKTFRDSVALPAPWF